MDGFPIYGPLAASDEGALDVCNGRRTERGGYRYHVRRVESVDLSVPYCRKHGSRWVAGWSIILGSSQPPPSARGHVLGGTTTAVVR